MVPKQRNSEGQKAKRSLRLLCGNEGAGRATRIKAVWLGRRLLQDDGLDYRQ